MTSNLHMGTGRPASTVAPHGPGRKADDGGEALEHSREAEERIRRYLSEIHSYRQLGNVALRELESRLAAISSPNHPEGVSREVRSAAASALAQPARPHEPAVEEDDNSRTLNERLAELSSYLHADLARQEKAQGGQRRPASAQEASQSLAPAPKPPFDAEGAAPRPAAGHHAHRVTASMPVLDRAWFEERFAAMRTSIDQLAERIPTQRLDALESQFHLLMEKLDAREAGRSAAAVEAGLKKLAAYLEDNKQWNAVHDKRVRGVEERLDQLSGLVAQSHAALSATAKGLEIVARGTGPQLARQTADLVAERLQTRLDALDMRGPIDEINRQVEKLSSQSAQFARSAGDRLKQLQDCLDESLDRMTDEELNVARQAQGRAGQARYESGPLDDDYDGRGIAAAQRAARLAGPADQPLPEDGEPIRYQIPYGEFLPEEERQNSRMGLIVAAVILLLASAAMLYLNLRDKDYSAALPSASVMGAASERPSAPKDAREAKPTRIALGGAPSAALPAPNAARSPAGAFDVTQGALAAAAPLETETGDPARTLLPIAAGVKIGSLGKAAVDGDAEAQFSVGQTYLEGRDLEHRIPEQERLSKEARWFRRAAENGHAPSQYRLATLYELGQGAPKDQAEAMIWYERAAVQGHVKAMHNLGVLSVTGAGRATNFLTAAKWFSKAAEHGLRDSQFNLGILYERGLGVEKDLSAAYRWFALAARDGDPKAEQRRDQIAVLLSEGERRSVEIELAAWKPALSDELANGNAPEPPAKDERSAEQAIKPRTPAASAQLMKANWTAEVSALDSIVAEAQRLLAKLGYKPGPVDGIAGPRTLAAIRAFEQSIGLPVTGRVTQALIARMAFAL
jgi:TPR repeat protein